MALALRFAARSDVGLLRDGNEDSGYAGHRLLVVADGMGGHAAGEVASSVAVATVAALDDDAPGPDLIDQLSAAVHHANDLLHDMVAADPSLEGMGTTLTAVLRSGSRLGVVHIGDSRCYLLRDRQLQQITHDHTFVQTLVDEGRITEEEASHHPQRSLITRALDGRGEIELDVSVREARAGDRYLLCSDGLSGVVSRETLEHTLIEHADPDRACEALVELALRGGGPDNVTCVVADVVDVEAASSGMAQAVGAAAAPATRERGERPKGGGAAERAAALNPRPTDPRDEEPHAAHPPRRRRWPLRTLGLLVVAGLVVGGGWAAYAWSQEQYYVGADADEVAIFQGINQDLFGLNLSQVHTRADVLTGELSTGSRDQVETGIDADDLAAAQAIVGRLKDEAVRCAGEGTTAPPPQTTPTPTPSPTLTPAPGPTSTAGPAVTAAPTASPTAGLTPAPTPTPAAVPPVFAPRGCEGVELGPFATLTPEGDVAGTETSATDPVPVATGLRR